MRVKFGPDRWTRSRSSVLTVTLVQVLENYQSKLKAARETDIALAYRLSQSESVIQAMVLPKVIPLVHERLGTVSSTYFH